MRRVRLIGFSAAAAVMSGALLAWAYGLAPWWGAAWVAPIPLLVAVSRLGWRAAAALGATSGAIASISMFAYLVTLAGPLDALSISAVRVVQWAAMAMIFRVAVRSLPPTLAVLVFPLLMAGTDVVVALVSPHGSAGSLAYSQMDALIVIQAASLGGTAAVTILPMLFASAVAVALSVEPVRRGRARAVAVPLIILLVALGFGAVRVSEQTAESETTVSLVSTDRFDGVPTDWSEVWAFYAPLIDDVAQAGSDVIVLPEKIFRIEERDVQEFLTMAAATVRAHGVVLIVGVDERGSTDANRAYVISSDGSIDSYDKRHLIPGIEADFAPGSAFTDVSAQGSPLAALICKDLDFPATVRDAVGDVSGPVAAIAVPAWDFDVDGWYHSRIAVMRGVENSVSVVRSARDGLLTVSDSRGRLLAEQPSTTAASSLSVVLPRADTQPTVYASVGDVFGWSALVIGGLGAGYSLWRTSQNTRRRKER